MMPVSMLARRFAVAKKSALPTLFTANKGFATQPQSDTGTNLKEVLARKIVEHQKKVAEFRKQHGNDVIGQITVDAAYGGMRSLKVLICETSNLDPEEGIRFRGYSIPECQKLLPKAGGGDQPVPEGIWWLLCTGDIPNDKQVSPTMIPAS